MEYLLILLVLFVISLFLEKKFKLYIYKSKRESVIIPLFFFIVGIIWDSFAVARNHWAFDMNKLSGIKLGLLPIEEYLFFLVIPYFIITFYLLLKKGLINI